LSGGAMSGNLGVSATMRNGSRNCLLMELITARAAITFPARLK
jgi:hypothetical protein